MLCVFLPSFQGSWYKILKTSEFWEMSSFVGLRKSVTTQFRFSSVLYNRSNWCLMKFVTVSVRLAVYYQFSWQKQLVLDTVCVVEQSWWQVVSTCHGWNCDIVETQEHLWQNCSLSSLCFGWTSNRDIFIDWIPTRERIRVEYGG